MSVYLFTFCSLYNLLLCLCIAEGFGKILCPQSEKQQARFCCRVEVIKDEGLHAEEKEPCRAWPSAVFFVSLGSSPSPLRSKKAVGENTAVRVRCHNKRSQKQPGKRPAGISSSIGVPHAISSHFVVSFVIKISRAPHPSLR